MRSRSARGLGAAEQRLDLFLSAREADLTRSSAARLIRAGLVQLNGRPARPADRVRDGDTVAFELPVTVLLEPAPEAIALEVIFEDDDFLVIVKPAGMVVHPAPGHHSGTLVHALLGRGGLWSGVGGKVRPGIVHRLDKDTSGLIVAARNDIAHRALAAQLADRSLSRTYLAVTRGEIGIASGVLEGEIGRDPRHRKRMAVVAGGRSARTRIGVVGRRPAHTLVRCDLETGRTHQIRVHLSAYGHPIAGDREYGGGAGRPAPRSLLHAWRLRLRHPRTGEEMSFESPAPDDLVGFWEALE